MPYRTGTIDNDPELGVVYRPDAITIIYVPQTAAQTTIREDMPQPSAEVKVTLSPGARSTTSTRRCADSKKACGS